MLGRTRIALAVFAVCGCLALVSACDSDSEGGVSCLTHDECPRGQYCTAGGVCGERECQSVGDCEGVGVVCLQDLGLCSARECDEGAAPGEEGACPGGYFCSAGTCLLREPGMGDTVGGDTTHEGDIKDHEIDEPVPGVPACTVCASSTECGDDMSCLQLGGDRHCLAACENDADCLAGWVCYPLTQDGDVCIPSSYQCNADCLVDGCDEGYVCDQVEGRETFGECVPALDLCSNCEHDWQCGEGYRCAMTVAGHRFCVAECYDDAPCDDWANCQEKGDMGGVGVMICMPENPTCCGPDCVDEECDPPCSGRLPICHQGRCVQCVEDEDCVDTGGTCVSNHCQGGPCEGNPTAPYELDGECVQCLRDEHCDSNICRADNTCEGDDPCGGACQPPYPGCAVINGVPSCVPCTEDAHCGTGACDTSTYLCDNHGITECGQDCVINGCPDAPQFDLACDTRTGCCYDRDGNCDNVVAFCNEEGGSECMSMMDIFMGGMIPGGLPGMDSGEFIGGMCTCDAAAHTLCNLLPNNPMCDAAPRCHDGVNCLPLGTIMELLMGGAGGGDLLFGGDMCTSMSLGDMF